MQGDAAPSKLQRRMGHQAVSILHTSQKVASFKLRSLKEGAECADKDEGTEA